MDKLKPSNDLREKILSSIKKEEIYHAKLYFSLSAILATASIFGLIFSVQYMIKEFYQSSFGSFLSIAFYDPSIALAYWKELSLSLLETLPILGITISLVAIYSLLVSIKTLVNHTRGKMLLSFNN